MPVTVQTFTTSGTWTCPAGIFTVKVELWGAGGNGGDSSRSNGRGGGGSGGCYSRLNSLSVVPGFTYNVQVGQPQAEFNASFRDSYFSSRKVAVAAGGNNGASTMSQSDPANAAGAVATLKGSIGDVVYLGGNGGNGVSAGSGGGGGGAGSNGAGGNASNNNAGTGTSVNGGNGAPGVSPASNGINGLNYGGGGSGAANSTIQFTTRYGGNGAPGLVVITYGEPDPTYICLWSSCNPLAVNCYLYNDQAKTSPVVAGYYSDGDNCFTVNSSGMITAVSSCTTNVVLISACVPNFMNCNTYYTFVAYADTNVNTNVDVSIYWSGDLGGFSSTVITIPSGSACNSGSIYTGSNINCFGEYASSVFVTYSPSSSGSQVYQDGAITYNVCPC